MAEYRNTFIIIVNFLKFTYYFYLLAMTFTNYLSVYK